MTEEWRAVLGYAGFYEVSSLGRVRRLDGAVRHPTGSLKKWRGGVMKPRETKKGYMHVHLSRYGQVRALKVAGLVCEAFHGPRPVGMEVAHEDGSKSNERERVENDDA